jgi:hypothetical protein
MALAAIPWSGCLRRRPVHLDSLTTLATRWPPFPNSHDPTSTTLCFASARSAGRRLRREAGLRRGALGTNRSAARVGSVRVRRDLHGSLFHGVGHASRDVHSGWRDGGAHGKPSWHLDAARHDPRDARRNTVSENHVSAVAADAVIPGAARASRCGRVLGSAGAAFAGGEEAPGRAMGVSAQRNGIV